MDGCTQHLRKPITQLETEVRALRKRDRLQRQRLAEKYGYEFLATHSNSQVDLFVR